MVEVIEKVAMDGCPGNRPATVQRRPVDIEWLLQWAEDQSIAPRLRVPSPRELTLNPYDVHVRGVSNVFCGAGVPVEGGRYAGDIDAERVLAALERLDPFTLAIVRVNARRGGRPDCMAGVEPRLVPVLRRSKKKHRKVAAGHRWEPCSPQAICAARELYGRWHAALQRLAATLDGQLIGFSINGFAAPAAPWEAGEQKAA